MTNQAVKALPFTFHGVSFDVVATGNADIDFNIGSIMSVLYLKIQRDNYNEAQPLPPNQVLLPEIVLTLALDVFLQPLSHAMRNGIDHLEVENLVADISNPNLDAENPSALRNLALNLG